MQWQNLNKFSECKILNTLIATVGINFAEVII